jgi:hypothetical protein
MKKIHLAPYCIALAVGNCILPSLLGQVADQMRIFYSGMHGGASYVVPAATEFALAVPLWFYIFTALTALAMVGLFIRTVSVSVLVHWLFGVCILECVALFFFVWGFCGPVSAFGGIMWTVGPHGK